MKAILVIFLFLFSSILLFGQRPPFDDYTGDGTADNPYKIYTKEHFMEFADSLNKMANPGEFFPWQHGKHFRLMENIDTIEQGTGKLQGIFHGNGKKIAVYLLCEYPDNPYYSLFAGMSAGGSIDSLIVDGYVNYQCGYIGITGTSNYISNCISNVRVISIGMAAGIASSNYVSMSRCINNGSITGGVERIGGVVATNLGTIENCLNTGKITATASGDGYRVGGIAGWSGSAISNCINLGEVHGQRAVSGIAAFSYSPASVFHCINYGYIKSEKEVGGVAGFTDGTAITNCVNVGAVEGDEDVGGIVGKE